MLLKNNYAQKNAIWEKVSIDKQQLFLSEITFIIQFEDVCKKMESEPIWICTEVLPLFAIMFH